MARLELVFAVRPALLKQVRDRVVRVSSPMRAIGERTH